MIVSEKPSLANRQLPIEMILMISEEEAPKGSPEKFSAAQRSVLLSQALSCFAAEDFFSSLPLPNFDNSATVVVASSCARGKRLRVIGEQPAALDDNFAFRRRSGSIFTGAPMPAGADAVVMQEDVMREGNEIAVNVDVDRDLSGAAAIWLKARKSSPRAS
jgi:molybdopterin molybdotransferase